MKKTGKIISWLCVFAVVITIAPVFLSQSTASAYANGDTIEFGSYPQTHITDEALIAELNAAGAEIGWTSYGYNVNGGADFAFYKDVVFDNVKYRAVQFSMYRFAYGGGSADDYGLQSARGYTKNTVHWFRFDPFSWTVLDPEEGLLIANAILDSQAINDRYFRKENSNIYYADPAFQYLANDYAHSTVRTWLQDSFATTAFTSQETSVLAPKMLTDATADMPEGYETFAYPSTEDAIFLLSYAEATNTEYFANKSFRSRQGTDYARAQGLNNYSVSNPFDFWFLRSPGNESGHQAHVNLQGNCLMDSADSYGSDIGICPAVYISLDAFDQLGTTGQDPSEPDTEPTTEPEPTEPNPPTDPYENLSFTYENSILTVSGTGAVPTADNADETPFARYAGECKVLVIDDGIESVQANAFWGLDLTEILILQGPIELTADAFSLNGNVDTVICADTVQVNETSFAEDTPITVYEPKLSPHAGDPPENCTVLPYSFSENTLYIEGTAQMDTYDLLDLMTIMCSYYNDVHFAHFDSYTSLDVPFYVYDKSVKEYVPAENNTLTGVSFSVKIPDGKDWITITFNEFCELAASNRLGEFHLVSDLEVGDDPGEDPGEQPGAQPEEGAVQENAFQIMAQAVRKVLKWIVGLLNYMFNILSKFKTA